MGSSVEWRNVPGYEGLYKVSNIGDVYNVEKDRIIESRGGIKGYRAVQLVKDGKKKQFLVHRLVALAFIPNPYNKPVVHHIDENKRNNSVCNLLWATHEENTYYSRETTSRALERGLAEYNKRLKDTVSRRISVRISLNPKVAEVFKNRNDFQEYVIKLIEADLENKC